MKKLTINTEVLKPALKRLSQAVAKKSVLPALSNIYLRAQPGKVEMITTDLELTISYLFSCECQDEFEMLIPFDVLHDSVNLMPVQPIEIQLHSKNKASIVSMDGPLHLGALDKVAEYPKIPDIPKKNSIELDDKVMEWLGRAMASTSQDELRPAMMKALLEIEPTGINIVSTNAHTLFRHKFPRELEHKEQILISPKIAKALEGFASAQVTWHAKHVALKSGDITVIATRSEDKFPNYKVVIPNHEANLSVSRNLLLLALNRATVINKGRISLRLDPAVDSSFTVIAADDDLQRKQEVSVHGSYTGKATEIFFSPELFKRMLHQIDFDQIALHVDGPIRGALISSEDDAEYLGMIMPLVNQ